MKLFPIASILILFLFLGCLGPDPPDNLYDYKGVTVNRDAIPEECWDLEDCEMYDCMVDLCWCKESPDQIVHTSDIVIYGEEDVQLVVEEYLNENSMLYTEDSFQVSQINEIFYGVFYEDLDGNEESLTVAVDGSVMETICGV